jgi:pectate lyase
MTRTQVFLAAVGAIVVALDISACDSKARGTEAPAVESQDGCPLDLVGFATLNAMGQDGTTGGNAGTTVTVKTVADLKRYATATEPHTILVEGAITFQPFEEVRVQSDKTILGVGTSGEIVNGGFFLASGVHNVIIRNLTIRDSYVEGDWDGKTQDNDGVQMDAAHHVWIDHCRFSRIGDGMIDSRSDTTYETVSWNIFENHNKTFGIGWTTNVTAQMTIHHNWIRDTQQRNPSVDNVLRAHLFNNFLQRVASYGNYARGGTHMVLENSVFDSVKDPHYFDDGSLVARGNIYRNTSGQQESSGAVYAAFDPHGFYSYTLDPAEQVEALLARCAGPRPELGR